MCKINRREGFFQIPVLVILGVATLIGLVSIIVTPQLRENDVSEVIPRAENQISTISPSNEGKITGEIIVVESSEKERELNTKTEENQAKTDLRGVEEKLAKETRTTVDKIAPVAAANDSPLVPQVSFNPKWRDAAVNLVCHDEYQNIVSTGSGVIIDSRGVILTNAHVASDLLFTKKWSYFTSPLDCFVRTGDPAVYRYRAEIMYISKESVRVNAESDIDSSDSGYEKYAAKDYAFLVITEKVNSEPELPKIFPYMPMYTGPIPRGGSYMHIIGYPARYVGYRIVASNDFRMIVSPVAVKEQRSVVGTSDLNIIAFQGVVAGQHGSSGGAVINDKGELVSIPTFFDKDFGEASDESILNTLTIRYVSEDLKKDTGLTLKEFASRDNPQDISDDFMNKHAFEYQCIVVNIERGHHGYSNLPECEGSRSE